MANCSSVLMSLNLACYGDHCIIQENCPELVFQAFASPKIHLLQSDSSQHHTCATQYATIWLALPEHELERCSWRRRMKMSTVALRNLGREYERHVEHLNDLESRRLVERENKPNGIYAITPSGKQAFLAHIKADPENAIRLGEG